MRVSDCVSCQEFLCTDVRHNAYVVPDVDIRPEVVRIMLISEVVPADGADYYYAGGQPLWRLYFDRQDGEKENEVLALHNAPAIRQENDCIELSYGPLNAPHRARTCDIRINSPTLYQLS